jgi:cyanophycin synthetase
MKILETKIMRGPNYWSNYHHKLIVTKLDIEAYEELPTNLIPEFTERLEALLPSLYGHRCSYAYEGGFFERLRSGTWMGHVIEHIALELQCLAGMECGFGRTRGAGVTGVYTIVIAYEIESAGLYAMQTAIQLALALAEAKLFDLEIALQHLRSVKARYGLDLAPNPSLLRRLSAVFLTEVWKMVL